MFDIGLQRRLHRSHLADSLAVIVIQFAAGRNLPVVIFPGQHQRAIHEIPQNSNQLVVVAGLKILPRKVVVLGFGRIGAEYVTKHILLARKLFEVFVQPHGPVARGRNLVAFEIQELIRRHVFGQDIAAVRLEHRREDDAVENDIVFADKMDHLGVLRLPIGLPIGCKVLCSRYITDRSVEPDIKHLPFGALHRHGNAPIEVAAYGTGLQTSVQPALALSVNIAFPLFVPFENPLAQKSFVLIQRQIPVFRLTLHGHGTRHGAVRIDQLVGREGRAALLALVAVSAVVAALGTGADDITVGEERLRLLVVILHRSLLDELPLVVQLAEKFRSGLGMRRRRSPRIDVERHSQPLERLFDHAVVTVHDLLRRHSLLAGLDGDGHAMFVASADRNHVAAPEPQVTGINVRRYVNSRQMADMHRPVGIGKSRGNEITLEFFCHKNRYSITNFCQN